VTHRRSSAGIGDSNGLRELRKGWVFSVAFWVFGAFCVQVFAPFNASHSRQTFDADPRDTTHTNA
jgi:hypothetical protein